MKNSLVFASMFAACLTVGAQDDAKIQLPKDPKAILEMAAPFYNYNSATTKPFYLSYHYRLLDNQGDASAEGKVEYWSSPGNVSRVSWTKGNNIHSEWRTADGKTLQSVKGDDITSMEHRLSSAVLFSLPNAQDSESSGAGLRLVSINNAGAVNLCVAVGPARAAPAGLLPRTDFLPEGLQGIATAYCFDSQSGELTFTLMSHTVTNSFSHIQKFQDHNIAGHIDIAYLGKKTLEADLEESKEVKAGDAAFTPSPDATEPVVKRVTVPVSALEKGGVKVGALIVRVSPIYPPEARAARISGTVVIQAIIGKDGILQNPKVVSSPDDALSRAALDAVRQWRYQPYTLNGAPVDVMTTINLSFTLDR